MTQAPITTLTRQLLFIDDRIEDRESLVAGLEPNTQVVVLETDRDGVAQISEVLANYRDIQAVHIISHGQSGALYLGSGVLNNTSLDDHRDALQGWNASLAEGADLLLYGCNVAEGEQGQAFINSLAQLTGADVAASDDLTGNVVLGGDWELEVQTGTVDTAGLSQSAMAGFDGVLGWQYVSAEPAATGNLSSTDFAVHKGTPYVVYKNYDGDKKVYVKVLEDGVWKTLGGASVSDGSVSDLDLKFHQDTPYLLYKDSDNGTATLSKYVNNAWQTVGEQLSLDDPSYANYLDLEFDSNGIPYAAYFVPYIDGQLVGQTIVKKLVDGSWQSVGATLPRTGTRLDLELDANDVPYLAYSDYANSNHIKVQKYEAGSWTSAGNGGLLTNEAEEIDLECAPDGSVYLFYENWKRISENSRSLDKRVVQQLADNQWTTIGSKYGWDEAVLKSDSNGILYLLYEDGDDKATVEAYDGTSWQTVGTKRFSGPIQWHMDLAVDGGSLFVEYVGGKYPNDEMKVMTFAASPTDANISITSTGSGSNGAYKIGDKVAVNWNSTADYFSQGAFTGVTIDFSPFGGGDSVAASSDGNGSWTASYTIQVGTVDSANRNVSITATTAEGSTSAPDTSNLTVDNQALAITVSHLSISGATGTGGIYKTGDTITASWDNSTSGDNNADTVASVNVDFSDFGGGTKVAATNDGGVWSANYTLVAGTIEASNRNVSITAIDDAGNVTSVTGTTNATVDNRTLVPSVPDIKTASDSGRSNSDNHTNHNTPTLSGTAEANSTVELFKDGVSVGTVNADSSGNWTYTATTLPDGDHAFTAKAVDVAGNQSAASETLTVTIDTTKPTLNIASISSDDRLNATEAGTDLTISGTTAAEDNQSVTVGLNGKTYTGAVSSGSWSVTVSKADVGSLTEGEHTVTADIQDKAGNAANQATQSLSVDKTAPSAPSAPELETGSDSGSSNSDNHTTDTTPTLSGTAEANSMVELFKDGVSVDTVNADGSGNWTYTATTLTDGDHVFTAKATDAAGNQSTASAELTVTIDTRAPAAPGTPELEAGSDSGSSNSDNHTNHNTPTLSGTAEANSTVELFKDGVSVGTVNADGSGNWTYTATTLTDGDHAFTAKATDAAGNQSDASEALTVAVDTAKPALNIASISSDNRLNAAEAETELTISGTTDAEDNQTVTVGLNGKTYTGTVSGGSWSVTVSVADLGSLAEDAHTVTADIKDKAGNAADQATRSLSVDKTAPSAPGTPELETGSDSGSSNSDNHTNDTTPTLSGTAEANSAVELFKGGESVGTVNADSSGNWTYTAPTLTDGDHAFTAKATDAVGNQSDASEALTVTIDTAKPTLNIASISSDNRLNAAEAETELTISGTTDAEDNQTITVGLNGKTYTGTVSGGSWSVTVPKADLDSLAEGSHTVTADIKDKAGNAADQVSKSLTVDKTAPTAPGTPDLDTDSDSGSSDRDDYTNDNTPTLSGRAEANSTVTLISSVDGTVGSVTADDNGDWMLIASTLTEGSHNLTAKASDAAGNVSDSSTALAITVDTAAPAAASGTLTVAENSADDTEVGTLSAPPSPEDSVSFSLRDNAGGRFSIDATTGTVTVVDGSQLDHETNSSHSITVRTTDKADNTTDQPLTVTVTNVNEQLATTGLTQTVNWQEDDAGVDISPAAITLSDNDGAAETITATLTLSDKAAGSLAGGGGSYDNASGVYTVTGSPDEVQTALNAVSFTPAADWDQALTIAVKLADGGENDTQAVNGTLSLAVTAVNDKPVLTGLDDIQVVAAGSAVALDTGSDATVSDVDSRDFNGGELVISGNDLGGRFSVDGTLVKAGADLDSADGNLAANDTLYVDGQPIGIVDATRYGQDGNDLTVRFSDDANATPAALQTLLQQLLFSAARPGTVTLNLTLSDGDGEVSVVLTPTVTVETSPPEIANLNGDRVTDYRSGQGPVLLDMDLDAVVTDADSTDFDGGTLTVKLSNGGVEAEDVLAIRHQGSGVGEINLTDQKVSLGSTEICRVSGGRDGAALVITLNAQADAEAVTALLQNITYENTSASPDKGTRTIDFVLTDGDGGTSATSSTTVSFYVAPPPEPELPDNAEVIDGTIVTTETKPNGEGGTKRTVKVDLVPEDRPEDDKKSPDLADIPLLGDEDDPDLEAGLPAGVGLTAEGGTEPTASDEALEGLHELIDQTGADEGLDDAKEGIEEYLEETDGEELWVQKMTLNSAKPGQGPDRPIELTGQEDSEQPVVLVIDASELPKGTELKLNHVGFVVIVGPATLSGGDGKNVVFAGEGSQTIVLGADDDELHGGDGDDTVGSKGGDDLIFGDNGNDTLFGGAGNDILHGGADIDVATYDGNRADYDIVQTNGVMTVTRKDDSSDSDTLVNIEQLTFADGDQLVSYDTELKALATLYQNVLGRQADLAGFQWWAEQLDNGASFGNTIAGFMQSDEYQGLQGQSFTALDNGRQLDALYQAVLGRAADEAGKAYWQAEFEAGMNILDVAHSFATSVELLGQLQLSNQWDFSL